LSLAGERRALARAVNVPAGQPTDVVDREVVMRHKNGCAVHVAWTAAPVRDARGRVIGAAGVGADISGRARLVRQVALIADEQRQQLGRDLHDTLGQELTAVGLIASSLGTAGKITPQLLAKLEAGVDAAKTQLRAIVKGLAPVEVDAAGLVIALDELAEYTRQRHGIDCRLDCPEPVDAGDNFTANQLYLIAREAVHNAVKHASPKHIVIRLRLCPGLWLAVEDDGCGIADGEPSSGGMGLRIMAYRSRIVRGELTVAPRDGGGTVLSCTLGQTDGRSTAATS
jgi:signal transduction histidine kinase